MNIRIVIADDSPDYLRLFELMLARLEGIEVVATARDGIEAVRVAHEQDVDVALLDIDMPCLEGFAAAEEIRRLKPGTRVILQTGSLADDVRRRADELSLFVLEKLDLVKNLELLAHLAVRSNAAA
jgi:CheY-like chemotaxis protein